MHSPQHDRMMNWPETGQWHMLYMYTRLVITANPQCIEIGWLLAFRVSFLGLAS